MKLIIYGTMAAVFAFHYPNKALSALRVAIGTERALKFTGADQDYFAEHGRI